MYLVLGGTEWVFYRILRLDSGSPNLTKIILFSFASLILQGTFLLKLKTKGGLHFTKKIIKPWITVRLRQ